MRSASIASKLKRQVTEVVRLQISELWPIRLPFNSGLKVHEGALHLKTVQYVVFWHTDEDFDTIELIWHNIAFPTKPN